MLAHITKMAGYTPGLTTTDGVYIDGQRTVRGRHDRPGVRAHGARRPADRRRGARDRARRPAARRHGRARSERRRGAQRAVRPPRPEGHRHARPAGRGEAHRGRGGEGLRGAQRRRSARAQDVGLHRSQEHLLRHDEPAARAGARAHPRRRPRLRARGRRQRPDDHAVRPQQPHPAGVDAPDSGDARRPRDAQRAERDVRRGDGVFARHQARRHPPGPAHLRLHVLPGAGPHERVRRASVQGAVRLRPQRARGRARWPTSRSGWT